MKYKTVSLLIAFLFPLHILVQAQKPCVAFSFDDGNTADILTYKGANWNKMIRDQLGQHNLKTFWFVVAGKLDNEAGNVFFSNGTALGI